jgi:hypothetical protein
MIGKLFVGLTIAVIAQWGAAAAGENADVVAGNGSIATASSGAVTYLPPAASPSGLVTIFSNMGAKYPKALYFSRDGLGISGPNNANGDDETWKAMAFTPSANHTVTRIQIAAGQIFGTNEIVVGLYSDNGGVPGSALKTWHIANLPPSGACCAIAVAKDKAGIPVTAGTQYWLVLKTDDTNADAMVIWNYNTTDEITPAPFAVYCSSDIAGSSCGAFNDVWRNAGTLTPALAFAVLGSD